MSEPSKDDPIEAELVELNEFLLSDEAPKNCMTLSELDGFLTAIAIGPGQVTQDEWMPAIWRQLQPENTNRAPTKRITGIITDRYDSILETISSQTPSYAPVFPYSPSGDPMPADWAMGFWNGMGMRHAAWLPLLQNMEDENIISMMLPIIIFVKEGDKPILDFPEEERQQLIEQAADIIPMAVVRINHYWQKQRDYEGRVGRNDLCPCGSGKKYKKCCLN